MKRIIGLLLLSCSLSATSLAQSNDKTLFMISNSHLDTQWNWDVKTTIGEYLQNTLTQNMALMDKYPYFNLNSEGAIKYMWMKEYYPDLYEKMKGYIQAGQWHVSGMSIDASDVMVSSAESILHSMLYANKFYEQEFGVRGGYDIMLPDCFGFSYALPTLAHHAGQKGMHTNKLAWGSAAYDKLPPFGIWQGVDGSQIYAIYKPGAYDAHADFNKDMTTDSSILSAINTAQTNYGVPAAFRYVGPMSDRGGGLKDDTSSTTGDNTPYWLNYSAQKTDGDYIMKMATTDEIFDYLAQQDQSKLSVWNAELPMRTHGVGAYTSRGELKMWNRRDELLADAAEKASSLAYWLVGKSYPAEIRDAWIHMLWQQHHDGITGTSIPKAYEYSHNEYYLANKEFGMALTDAIGNIAQYVNTNVEGTPIIVYNPLSHEREDVVEGKLDCNAEPDGIRVFDKDGNEVLSQITGYKNNQLSFIFAAKVPSLGYAVYDVKVGEASTLSSNLAINADDRTLQNGRYKVTLNKYGDPNLHDLVNSRSLMSYSRQQLLSDYESTWPAWEISYSDETASPTGYVNENVEISIAENGPLRKSFKVTRTGGESSFVEYIRMNALSDRVDCVNEVDWQNRETMLKVNFPFPFSNAQDTYDISLGTITRGVRSSDEYEVLGHQWADQSEASGKYGVSILNDSKYGWDKPNTSSLRLTLLHTPGCGAYQHQAEQDLGPNKFTYSLFPHEGNWSELTQKEAAHLNQPLIAFVPEKHEGALDKEMSFVSLSTDKVSVKALKKAEESDELIVRVYEWTGEDQDNVTMTFPTEIESASEVNALEENIGSVKAEGNTISFSIGHYQPKSFAVKLKSSDFIASKKEETTNSSPVDLSYNLDVMSYDSSRGDGSSTYVYAYPAEMIKDTLSVDGIPFKMGSRENGQSNAIRCNISRTVSLDRKEGQNKLYLLLASGATAGTTANIQFGDTTVCVDVPYFTGYAGQPLTQFNLEQKYITENIAFTATHAHNISSKSNEVARFMYMYKYCINLPEGVNEVKLSGNNRMLLILAATLSDNKADELKEFTPINTRIEYDELGDNTSCGERLTPDKVAYSHQNNTNEGAAKANDGDITTKWCVTSSQSTTPYLEYQFNEPVEICSYLLLNAGVESSDWITSDFRIQRYDEDSASWIDVDTETSNTANKVERGFEPFEATKIRLQIDKGEQNGNTTRVYEFAVYGKDAASTAIKNLHGDSAKAEECGIFTADGMKITQLRKGINIIRYTNGSTRKVLVK